MEATQLETRTTQVTVPRDQVLVGNTWVDEGLVRALYLNSSTRNATDLYTELHVFVTDERISEQIQGLARQGYCTPELNGLWFGTEEFREFLDASGWDA